MAWFHYPSDEQVWFSGSTPRPLCTCWAVFLPSLCPVSLRGSDLKGGEALHTASALLGAPVTFGKYPHTC